VLTRLGQFVMAQAELRGKVFGNLVYPAFLVVAGTVILGVVFGIFVPKFKPLLANVPDLPSVTKLVFGVSSLVAESWMYALPTLAALGVGAWYLLRRPDSRLWLAKRSMKLPIYGPLARSLAAARFCRLLGTMLANGIPLLTAMQISKEAAGNVLMEEAIDRATESVRAGQQLAPPLAESGLFGDEVVEMISVGESANNLDEVLTNVSATIEGNIDRMLTTAIRLLEPVLLLAIALVVAVVAAGLILPMTQMKAGF
jgi:general secretion pathway protein F/type IV pilus assembly protein PilC